LTILPQYWLQSRKFYNFNYQRDGFILFRTVVKVIKLFFFVTDATEK